MITPSLAAKTRLEAFRLLFVVTGIGAALAVMNPLLGASLAALTAGALLLLFLLVNTVDGRIEPIILAWVFLFPLGYYFLSFPREKSIVTWDRVVLAILVTAMARVASQNSERVPQELQRAAIAWAIFLGVTFISLLRGGDLLTLSRLIVDSFGLPAILGWCVIRNFDVRRHAAGLAMTISVMAIYVACIGAAEVIVKEDLLPLPGSGLTFAGSITRPNGPFYSNDSFALIGFITFCLLLFLRKTSDDVPAWQRFIRNLGIFAALATAMMPLFRSMGIALMVVLLIATVTTQNRGWRAAGVSLMLVCVGAVSIVSVLAPDAFEDRSRPDNFYSRMAEQVQAFHVFMQNPIFGVGLTNFTAIVSHDTKYLALYRGVQSVDSPHNNLSAILSETGTVGFVPYVTAHLLLVAAFWRMRRWPTLAAKLAWIFFLCVFLGYWINGMSLASGYNSDVNLWFIFAIAVFYKYWMTDQYWPRSLSPAQQMLQEFNWPELTHS